ncbi:hypothetical protein J2X54_001687 [Duganella sp. 3397]|uniref:hypothetical protein n=1 Tax=Duganella sp. 3397 TaxID=2817732 RepID=UPI0028679260|nr:hypothetical protein [Duganella sp. 3397]MDR7049239.1 hypothetical protein [Duganella sp. 3397]
MAAFFLAHIQTKRSHFEAFPQKHDLPGAAFRCCAVRRCWISLLLAVCATILPAAVAAPPTYRQVLAPVEAGIDIPVDLYWPANAPRALVIVAPNSGGLADPYFDPELQQATYRPDHRGGLVEALTGQGYAVAFFSLRGFAPLRECAHGDHFAARATDFATHCVNSEVRGTANLVTTTADTEAVFHALSALTLTGKLPQVALAFSEGMHHVTLLAGQGRIAPAGIVGAGGPTAPLSALWAYQMQRGFYVGMVQKAFDRCRAATLDLDRVFACAEARPLAATRAGLQEFLGATAVSPATLAARRQYAQALYRQALAHYAGDVSDEVMPGAFGGVRVPAVWNGSYYSQVFQTRASTVVQLQGYTGKTIYLFGQLDYLQLPDPGACAASPRCSIRTIDAVGHGLEDESGIPPAHAVQAIVDAVNTVSAIAPAAAAPDTGKR